jgi:hypothetical protein
MDLSITISPTTCASVRAGDLEGLRPPGNNRRPVQAVHQPGALQGALKARAKPSRSDFARFVVTLGFPGTRRHRASPHRQRLPVRRDGGAQSRFA